MSDPGSGYRPGMTESRNPSAHDPGGATAPTSGAPGAPELTDAGALGTGEEQWGPARVPKTDAADPGEEDPVAQPGRSVAAEDDPLAPQTARHPETIDAGRGESTGSAGPPGGTSAGRGDAVR